MRCLTLRLEAPDLARSADSRDFGRVELGLDGESWAVRPEEAARLEVVWVLWRTGQMTREEEAQPGTYSSIVQLVRFEHSRYLVELVRQGAVSVLVSTSFA